MVQRPLSCVYVTQLAFVFVVVVSLSLLLLLWRFLRLVPQPLHTRYFRLIYIYILVYVYKVLVCVDLWMVSVCLPVNVYFMWRFTPPILNGIENSFRIKLPSYSSTGIQADRQAGRQRCNRIVKAHTHSTSNLQLNRRAIALNGKRSTAHARYYTFQWNERELFSHSEIGIDI